VLAVISKAIKEARGPADPEGSRGDPQRHPYVIRVEYNEQAGKRDPKLYYDAMKMGQIPMTAQVHGALVAPPPDISKIAERFNLTVMRARLEEHALVKLPLDKYFEKAFALEAKEKASAPAPPAEPMVPEVGRNPGSVGYPIPPPVAPVRPAFMDAPMAPGSSIDFGQFASSNPSADDSNPLIACEGCGQPVRMLDPKCMACGKVFVVEAAPPPPPPRLPTRAEILARQQGMVTASAQVQPPVLANGGPVLPGEPDPWGLEPSAVGGAGGFESASDTNANWPGDPSDDIPFSSSVFYGAREAWNR
jgi:hypothetical protein